MPAKSGEGPSFPVFVAGVASNHHRDLKRCLDFGRSASEIGNGAVRFQLFRIRTRFAVGALQSYPKALKHEAWELPVSFVSDLSAATHAAGEMFPHVDFYKIAPHEPFSVDLLKECARTGKPVVLSTGWQLFQKWN
jgi:N-acetylneuraminate synthase